MAAEGPAGETGTEVELGVVRLYVSPSGLVKKSTHRNAVLLARVRHLALAAPTCSDPRGPALSW